MKVKSVLKSIFMILFLPMAIPITLAFAIAENISSKSNKGFKIGLEMWKEIITLKFDETE